MEKENAIPITICADTHGYLFAVLPNGEKKKLIADVYGNPYYGAIKLFGEEVEKEENHEQV